MLKLNSLKSPEGAHRNIKRLGRGQGSGLGQQAGKGHKGQKARNGGGVRLGFEGGQMPIYRRVPKKGFSNFPFKVTYATINLSTLAEKFAAGETVDREALVTRGILKGENKSLPLKVLAKGELDKKLVFLGIDKFSKQAEESIKKLGGSIS